MSSCHIPPYELQEQILKNLEENSKALANCSLVCRQWLAYARKLAFQRRPIIINASQPSSLPHLMDILSHEHCSIYPHVSKIKIISQKWHQVAENALMDQYIPNILPYLKGVRTVLISGFSWPDLPPAVIMAFLSFKSLIDLKFHKMEFLDTLQLLDILHHYQRTLKTCALKDIRFQRGNGDYSEANAIGLLDRDDDSGVDNNSEESSNTGIILPHVKIRLSMTKLSTVIKLFRNRRFNVESLGFHAHIVEPGDINRLSGLIEHLAESLMNLDLPVGCFYYLYTENYKETPISLKQNTNLRRLDVGSMIFTANPTLDDLTWFPSIIRTISSEHFKTLYITLLSAEGPYGRNYEGVLNIDWKSVEDALTDTSRFPILPTLGIRLAEYRSDIALDIVKYLAGTMPKIHNQGKLQFLIGPGYRDSKFLM